MDQTKYDQAIAYAFRLLGFRIRTSKEMADRLGKKGYPEETVVLVLDRLKELGYLNDAGYVESYIRSRVKPTGRRRLQYELLGKGIEKDTVENVLSTNFTPEQEIAAAQVLAEKLWRIEQRRERDVQNGEIRLKVCQRITQKLLARGFTYPIVIKVMRKFAPDMAEND